MIDFFDYKKIMPDGKTLFLGSKVFELEGTGMSKTVIVPHRFAGRLDRYVFELTDDIENIDDVMRVNGIYNPFSVDEGEMLIVPDTAYNRYFKESDTTTIEHSSRRKAADEVIEKGKEEVKALSSASASDSDDSNTYAGTVANGQDNKTDDERISEVSDILKTNVDQSRLERINKRGPNER